MPQTHRAKNGTQFVVDIGGEGRHSAASNVNPRPLKTLGPQRGQPIPRLIHGRAENVPLPDHTIDMVIVERSPLSRRALEEIKRIGRPGALVVLRHARAFGRDPHLLAKEMLSGKRSERECEIELRIYQETIIELDNGCLRQPSAGHGCANRPRNSSATVAIEKLNHD